ncbi:MAG: hypothetical protein MI807_21785 [Verrucomicrobiales bacterium]|nr:hypothetical protein [Verrucomicrobiales bacterium]
MKVPVITVCSVFLFASSGAQDVVHLKSGESAAATVTAITDNIVTYTLPSVIGVAGGSARRTLQMDRVSHVEWGFRPGEEADWQQRESIDSETAEKWWNEWFASIHRPRSRTAGWGIAFGNALLRKDSAGSGKRALSLFDRIIEKAWSKEDVAAAKQGRLRALIAVGDLKTAVQEAAELATRTEDPGLLIEVKFLLAEADFLSLKKIEEENPRWEEDDEVRPERNLLFHRTIDQYLWPHLFHATRDDAASRGLLAAGKVYEFGGDTERARACYVDLGKLYSGSDAAKEAEQRLDNLTKQQENSSQDSESL